MWIVLSHIETTNMIKPKTSMVELEYRGSKALDVLVLEKDA